MLLYSTSKIRRADSTVSSPFGLPCRLGFLLPDLIMVSTKSDGLLVCNA